MKASEQVDGLKIVHDQPCVLRGDRCVCGTDSHNARVTAAAEDVRELEGQAGQVVVMRRALEGVVEHFASRDLEVNSPEGVTALNAVERALAPDAGRRVQAVIAAAWEVVSSADIPRGVCSPTALTRLERALDAPGKQEGK